MILFLRRCAILLDFFGFVKGAYRTWLGGIGMDVSVSFQRDCFLSLLDSSLEAGRERNFDGTRAALPADSHAENNTLVTRH